MIRDFLYCCLIVLCALICIGLTCLFIHCIDLDKATSETGLILLQS